MNHFLHCFDRVFPFGVSAFLAAIPIGVAEAGHGLSLLNAEGWLQLALQAGSTFIFALFLLWVWPQQMKFQREIAKDMQNAITANNEANAKVVSNLSASFERHDEAWRKIIIQMQTTPGGSHYHRRESDPKS